MIEQERQARLQQERLARLKQKDLTRDMALPYIAVRYSLDP